MVSLYQLPCESCLLDAKTDDMNHVWNNNFFLYNFIIIIFNQKQELFLE